MFLDCVGSPRDFLGVLNSTPIRSSMSLEIRSTPPRHPTRKDKNRAAPEQLEVFYAAGAGRSAL